MESGINAIFKRLSGDDAKLALQELKTLLKSDECIDLNNQQISVLVGLLDSDEPKIRQNAAACLGEARAQDALGALLKAYKSDETRYNKAVYAGAISKLDFTSVKDELSAIRQKIVESEHLPEDIKHITAQMRELNDALRPYDAVSHSFSGYELINEAVLLTNRNYKEITCNELGKIPNKTFNAGVMVKTKHLDKVLEIRTFDELLFVPEGIGELPCDPKEAAENICACGITDYLKKRHTPAEAPFYFRVEYKNRDGDAKSRAAFEKAFAAQLELGSKWQLINSVDSYELEFRLVEGSNGRLKPLIGMRTLKDERFAYRKKSISTGMKPYLAALLVRLSSGFVKDNAVVMDMMCGSGIFLIEREMLRPCRMLYGIDIYGQAIDAARENIRAAGKERKTELITRDLHDFTFKHEVDEIYADTPAVSANRSAGELSGLIECFFKKSAQFLATDGHVFVYTHNAELIRSIAIKQGFVLTDSFEISKLEKSRYIVFSRARV